MRLGTGEYVVLAIILFFIFSASRMGQLGNAIGKFVYSFRKASRGEGFVDGKAITRRDEPEDAQLVDESSKPRS